MLKVASLRRLVLVLSLGLVLAPAASAATLPWSDLVRLLPRIGWGELEKAGCSISPDGQAVCPKEARRPTHHQPRPVNAKYGCSVDPNGHTACTP
jgi:hypothetical protein